MLMLALAAGGAMYAQDLAASVAALQQAYNGQKGKILGAAQAMPEDGYTLVPGEGSRTFGAAVGHIADAMAGTCGGLAGTPTQLNAERGMTSKADLVAALEKGFELCDKAYGDTTEANFFEPVQSFRGPTPRNATLWTNFAHSEEMYGTLAVYLRIKGIVPPSTAARGGGGRGKGKGRGGRGK